MLLVIALDEPNCSYKLLCKIFSSCIVYIIELFVLFGRNVAKIAIIYNLSIGAVIELDYLCSVTISTADHIYIFSVELAALPRVYFAPLLAVHLLHI